MNTKQKTKASAKRLLTSLAAGTVEAEQAQEQTALDPISAKEAEVGQAVEQPTEKPAQADSPPSVQPSSTEPILDNEPLTQRIMEALILVDRVDKLKLCEQLGVPVPEFNAAITRLVEAGAVKENAIDKTLYLALTDEERKEYEEDLATVKRDDRFTALSRIHTHRTYREEYRSWDEFLHHELCLENPHDWWEREKRKVRIQRLMDERGLKLQVPLNKDMAKHLNRVRDDAAVFFACVSEFQSLPQNRQIAKRLGEIVDGHLDRKSKLASLRQFVPDATEEELAILSTLGTDHNCRGWYPKHTTQLQERVQASGRPERECMLEIAQEIKALPSDTVLLGVARGADLVPLVNDLKRMLGPWQQEQKKKDEIEEWQRQGRRLGIYKPQGQQATEQVKDKEDGRPDKEADEEKGQEQAEENAVDDEKHEDQDQEGESEDTSLYDVDLTGAFAEHTDHMTVNTEDLAEFMRDLADALDEGWVITQPSSLTVRPVVRQEQSA